MIPIRISLWLPFCLLLCINCVTHTGIAEAADAGEIVCPGPDEAFVTTCSGSGGAGNDNDESGNSEEPSSTNGESEVFDDAKLLDEVLEDAMKNDNADSNNDNNQYGFNSNPGSSPENDDNSGGGADPGFASFDRESSPAMQQLKETTSRLIERYYDPLPHQGKCAIGTACGFAASRLSLGVANRLFRIAGATFVLSELMHTSGYCDEAQCLPDEARPWVRILRQTLVNQCIKVRKLARRIWNQDRIREWAQKDELVAGGFAAGAFVGFIV